VSATGRNVTHTKNGRSIRHRLLYAIGTRPEVIRSADILNLLGEDATIDLFLLNTLQHYDDAMMSDLLEELALPTATYTLPRLDPNPAIRSGQMIEKIAVILSGERFDAAVVYGDTDSSLCAALAAAKASVPVIHVEAGCRSGDLRMQEELNRRLIDHMSSLLLAVSENCAGHLRREEVTGTVQITGDPQFDVFMKTAPAPTNSERRINQGFITVHRSENVDDPSFFPEFLKVLARLNSETGMRFVWPVHPRAKAQMLDAAESGAGFDELDLIEPMAYGPAMRELARSTICITDSGGLQKEAFWLHVPCITIRPSTEWTETVELGANRLAPSPNVLFETAMNFLGSLSDARWSPDPYGGAGSSQRVAMAISGWLANDMKQLS
jgi:UDP-GlcNAc3NAcA epimerase